MDSEDGQVKLCANPEVATSVETYVLDSGEMKQAKAVLRQQRKLC